MASWLNSREFEGDENRLPPVQRRSKIPVKVTRLSSDSEKSSSSEDETDKKRRLPRNSVDKLQNKQPSRIPIVVDQKKSKVDKKKKLPSNVTAIKGEKPLGRDSGINLRRETREKQASARQARTKTSTSPPTAAKRTSRKPAKPSTPQVRRRIPRQLTPLETTQVSKDQKEPRDETSASDSSSAARTNEITPDFECNIARVEDGDLLTGAESNLSGSEYEDDFVRHSISSDEKAMPDVPPWLRAAVKERKLQEEKAAKLADDEKNSSQGATETMQEPAAAGHESIHEDPNSAPKEGPTVNQYQAPKDICTDFLADDLEKLIADLSVMKGDMTDEEHADAMASLLLLRDEARERKEVAKDEANLASSVNDAGGKPECEAEDKIDEKALSEEDSALLTSEDKRIIAAELKEEERRLRAQYAEENRPLVEYIKQLREGSVVIEDNTNEKEEFEEEFDCSSVSVSSEGERIIAALDEKSRKLKEEFAEENRLAFERLDKIRDEIKQSQTREDSITIEIEDIMKRQEDNTNELRRLDEVAKKRERDDKKFFEKLDKKKKKNAHRLEKIRADRRRYREETENENDSSEKQDQPVDKLRIEPASQEGEECKDPAKETGSCSNEDTSNKILYEPHEIKEYSSVKQLVKERKELRRLEKMEKKAIKREKLEQRERKKIEKEKRKVERKLERKLAKMRAKDSTVSHDETLESSKCVNDEPTGLSSTLAKENSKEPQTVNETEEQFTTTCAVDEIEQAASNKESDQDPAEGDIEEVTMELRNTKLNLTGDVMKTSVFDSNISEPEMSEIPVKDDIVDQRSFRLENDNNVDSDTNGSVKEKQEKKPSGDSVKEKSTAMNPLDEQQKRIFDENQMDDKKSWDDVEIECLEKEDTLNDASFEFFSIEEELDIQPDSNPQDISVPDVLEIPVETGIVEQTSFRFENDYDVKSGMDGSGEEELENKPSSESVKEKSKASNLSDEQQKRIVDDNQVDNEEVCDDVEIECLEKEDISVELFSIEEELDIQPDISVPTSLKFQ
ncbi:hypothetical protein OS493_021178 [Desmophyllum pertusum]|uniref:Uncharacterized protein n=1 Tax=Desmophyllum pertusum TaxID=174260 RepID=A0A9W9ZMT4_9CNID|nr:hypothetical protein OS493_021178 [Desmophyllum pertusum]